MRIEVDTGRCIGASQCSLTAPELFDQDDSGLVVVLQAEPGPEAEPAARTAADLCPSGAVRIREDRLDVRSGGQAANETGLDDERG